MGESNHSQYACSASQCYSDSFDIKKITFLKEFDAASVPDALFLLMAHIPGEIPVPVPKLYKLRENLELIIIC